MEKLIIKEIKATGKVSAEMRKNFFQGFGFGKIRNWLGEHDLDRHMPIELESTEVAVLTPEGVLMQVRPTDANQLGAWGGVLEENETPVEGAVRELFEETGIQIEEDLLEAAGVYNHSHKYDNQDQAIFTTYRFILRLGYVPERVEIDEESAGFCLVASTEGHPILKDQLPFIKEVLGEK